MHGGLICVTFCLSVRPSVCDLTKIQTTITITNSLFPCMEYLCVCSLITIDVSVPHGHIISQKVWHLGDDQRARSQVFIKETFTKKAGGLTSTSSCFILALLY